jgi:hypothetical protein
MEVGYKKGSYEDRLINKDFCKYYKTEGHMINQCEDFRNEVIQMMTRGSFKIEGKVGRDMPIVDESNRNKEVCLV